MSQLPQIVRESLRASGSAGAHPDPDVLTAFSERSLLANERAVVLEHLARCGDCREILSLALPALETTAGDEVREVEPSHSWLSWPALRWGFALAGVAIVVGIGVVEYQQHARSAEIAYSQKPARKGIGPAAPASAPAQAKGSAPQTQPGGNPELESKSGGAATSLSVATEPSSQLRDKTQSTVNSAAPGSIAADSRHGLLAREPEANAMMKVEPNESPAAPPPAPRAHPAAVVQPPARSDLSQQAPAQQMPEMVEVQSQGSAVTTADQSQGSPQKQLDLPRAQQQRASNDAIYFHAEGDKDEEMSRAKAPVPQSPEKTTAFGNNGSIGGPIQPGLTGRNIRPLTAPTWNITSTGTLQRSLNGGKAWEDVDVSNVRVITGLAALAGGALAKDSRASENKKENRKEKTDAVDGLTKGSSAVVFLAVSVNSFDVWAGGSGGALYHSVDGGNQWTRVFPTVNAVVLTGDIAGIQFSDPEHGTLTTTASEVWNTADGGHSWQRR